MTTVVDASAYLHLLLEVGSADDRPRFDADLAAPDLLFVEISTGLVRAVRRGAITSAHAALLLEQVLVAPIDVTPTGELVRRAFELRENVGVHDACYVALAEELRCGILTADRRLADAPGIDVPFTVV